MLCFLKQVVKSPACVRGWRLSSSFTHLDVEHLDDGYSIMKMHNKPVNSFNLEFIHEVIEALDSVEQNPSSRGLVLTSSLKVFSAGLDIKEMYNPEQDPARRERLRIFWTAFQELNLRFHKSPLVTIAAINGAAPAGGCALSLNCDYRIMADGKFTIGLNETHLGLTAPYWLCKAFQSVVGQRQAEKHLSLGTLMSPKDALNIGLIDEVVASEDLMPTVAKEMKKWLAIPEVGRSRTKALLRMDYIKDFDERRSDDLEMFTGVVNDPRLQKLLTKYLQALQGRNK